MSQVPEFNPEAEARRARFPISHAKSPFDRGSCDKWYGRSYMPHKRDHSGQDIFDLTPEEAREYARGYDSHDDTPGRGGKDWF